MNYKEQYIEIKNQHDNAQDMREAEYLESLLDEYIKPDGYDVEEFIRNA